MLSASISATWECACLPSPIYRWALKLRLNFFHLGATNRCGNMGRFGIALFIYMESNFWWAQINTSGGQYTWTLGLHAQRTCEYLRAAADSCCKIAISNCSRSMRPASEG